MASSREQVAETPAKEAEPIVEVEALRGYHLARQAANRHNRNLLQYGAGLAAILGINAGTGGMMALAESLTLRSAVVSGEAIVEPMGGAFLQLSFGEWMITITAIAAVLLVGLVVMAYRARQRAERRADEHVEKLIAIAPQWFRPGGGVIFDE